MRKVQTSNYLHYIMLSSLTLLPCQLFLNAEENPILAENVRKAIIDKHISTYRKLDNAYFVIKEKSSGIANKGVLYKYDFCDGNMLTIRARNHAQSVEKYRILPSEIVHCANNQYAFKLHKKEDGKTYVIQYSGQEIEAVRQLIYNELTYTMYSFSTIIDKPLHVLLRDARFVVTRAINSNDNGKNVLRLDISFKSTTQDEPTYTGHILLDINNDYSVMHFDVNLKFYEPNQKKDGYGRMIRDISYTQNPLSISVPSTVRINYETNVYSKQNVEWEIISLANSITPKSSFRLPAFGLTDITAINSGQSPTIPWVIYFASFGILCLFLSWLIKRKRPKAL